MSSSVIMRDNTIPVVLLLFHLTAHQDEQVLTNSNCPGSG